MFLGLLLYKGRDHLAVHSLDYVGLGSVLDGQTSNLRYDRLYAFRGSDLFRVRFERSSLTDVGSPFGEESYDPVVDPVYVSTNLVQVFALVPRSSFS